MALNNRPEIASRQELVAAANLLLRREKKRPLLPNLIVTSPATATGLLAAGNFSSGANGMLNTNGSRLDIAVAAVWELQNGGVGNIGLIRQRRAEQELASIELTRTVFRVKSEVSQAVARLQTARVRVVETDEGVRQAIESADKNFIGLRETTRPAGELLAPDHPPPGGRRRTHRLEYGLRAVLRCRERVQRRPVRGLPRPRPAGPVGHVPGGQHTTAGSVASPSTRGIGIGTRRPTAVIARRRSGGTAGK